MAASSLSVHPSEVPPPPHKMPQVPFDARILEQPREVAAVEVQVVMGTTRVDPAKKLPQTPFNARIPAGFIAAKHALDCALTPDNEGRRVLENCNFSKLEPVELVSDEHPRIMWTPNGLARRIGMHAESQSNPNAAFDAQQACSLITLDDPISRVIVANENYRIALALGQSSVISNTDPITDPTANGVGFLLRAITDKRFKDNVLHSMQTGMDSIDDEGYSFLCGLTRIVPPRGSDIWRNTLPEYKMLQAGTNPLQYQMLDGFCWAHSLQEKADRCIAVHAGEIRQLGIQEPRMLNTPHGWVRLAVTADHDAITQNFNRTSVRDRIIVTPALSNIAVLGSATVTNRANFYNHPLEEGSGPHMEMAPGFPADACLARTTSFFLDGQTLKTYRGRPEMLQHLCDNVVAPYVAARADLAKNRANFGATLPKGALSTNEIDTLRGWSREPHGSLPLSPDRVIAVYAHIVSLIHEAAMPIFGKLQKLA